MMGEAAWRDMAAMEMPLPDNTLPMMTGDGPFGPIEMGGMFTVVRCARDLHRNDYKDPGWFKHPEGTVAHEWKADPGKAAEAPPATPATPTDVEVRVVKPTGPMNH